MKPALFEYIRADSVEDAVGKYLGRGDDVRILAGGQSLIAMLNMRLTQPRAVIDISRISELDRIEHEAGHLVIGASTTQSKLERFPGLENAVPLLAMAMPYVGHFQTRNKGTICGSIAHADPSSELPLCMAVLDGSIQLMSYLARGNFDGRTVPGSAFFTGLLQTECASREMITYVRFPIAKPGEGYAFNEVSIRHGDFALIAVAVKATATDIRIGIGGAADKPHVRDWPVLEGGALDDALNTLAWELAFQEDVHASAKYRRHLVRTLGRRTVLEALRNIQTQSEAGV